MVRKFFFLCATIVALVLAIHFTSSTARGQGAGSLVALEAAGAGTIFAVDAAGSIYSGEGCFGNLKPFARIGQIPAGRTPTCMGAWSNGQDIFVGCSNGDVYSFGPSTAPGFTATFCANVLGGGPTPTAAKTNWGSLKARYR